MPFDAMGNGPQSDADLLRAARSLIAIPSLWTQGAYSRNRWDYTARCAMMALGVACGCGNQTPRVPTGQQRQLARLLVNEMPRRGGFFGRLLPANGRLIMFNDSRRTTHDDVLRLFDRAIAREAVRQRKTRIPVYLYA